ncbi:MAG: hypothetical protein ACYCXA_00435 [Actinomycetes bacterium]
MSATHPQADLEAALRVLSLPTPGQQPADATTSQVRIDTARDPQAVESVAVALAHRLKDVEAHVVVVWDDLDDCVLAHIVARELGCTTVRAFQEEGLLFLDRELPGDGRVVVLSAVWNDDRRLHSLISLVQAQRGQIVAAAAVLGSNPLREVTPGSVPSVSVANPPMTDVVTVAGG